MRGRTNGRHDDEPVVHADIAKDLSPDVEAQAGDEDTEGRQSHHVSDEVRSDIAASLGREVGGVAALEGIHVGRVLLQLMLDGGQRRVVGA